MDVVFYGVRGTRTVTGRQFERHGGDTACVGVHVGEDKGSLPAPLHLLFDAGTGIAAAGEALAGRPDPVTLFLSHLHHDHLAGLPFFAPLFEPGRRVQVFIPEGTKEGLLAYFAPPYFPLTVDDLPARVALTELPRDGAVVYRAGHPIPEAIQGGTPPSAEAQGDPDSVVVRSLRLPPASHPRDGVTAYAVQAGEHRVVYLSDFEWLRTPDTDQARVLAFAKGADVLIIDAQYTEDEGPDYEGRGHNTAGTAAALGEAMGAGHIVLFHHDPFRHDAALDALTAEARRALHNPNQPVTMARAGWRITLRQERTQTRRRG